ncbi:MAG TPA: hypothetical protein VIX11_14335 [Candidatus Acidoferrum sp.]
MTKVCPPIAVAGTGRGHFQFVVARKLQRVLNILDGGNLDDAVDRCFVQVAGVIDVTADLLEGQLLRGRSLQDQRRGLGLIRIRRINEIGFFFLGGRGGVIKKLFRGDHHQRRQEQKCDQPAPSAMRGGCFLHHRAESVAFPASIE